jgi:uncharacterized membrane protein
MRDTDIKIGNPHLEKIVFIIYLLHFFSALTGLLTPAFIVTAFLTGWPSIIAVIMSYFWRNDADGSYLESHFSWLIRTFWFTVLWLIVAWFFIVTIIGMVIGIPMLLAVGIWVMYRLLKGVFAMNVRRGII